MAKTIEINVEQNELIRKIADEKGMKNSYLLQKFFARRFPTEMNEIYIGEWVGRFMSGNPTSSMDFESMIFYVQIIAEVFEHDIKVKIVSEALKKAQDNLKEKESK